MGQKETGRREKGEREEGETQGKKGERRHRDTLEKGERRDDRDPGKREEPSKIRQNRYRPALLSPSPAMVSSVTAESQEERREASALDSREGGSRGEAG